MSYYNIKQKFSICLNFEGECFHKQTWLNDKVSGYNLKEMIGGSCLSLFICEQEHYFTQMTCLG